MASRRKVKVEVVFVPEHLAILRTGRGRLGGEQCWCVKAVGIADRKRRLRRVSACLAVVERPEDAHAIGAEVVPGSPSEAELRECAERVGRAAVSVLRAQARRDGWMTREAAVERARLRLEPAWGGVH